MVTIGRKPRLQKLARFRFHFRGIIKRKFLIVLPVQKVFLLSVLDRPDGMNGRLGENVTQVVEMEQKRELVRVQLVPK